MYRIELAPGEVTVFRTIDELATGVRNGVITARARIFHGASQKWLPIEFHPHYKLALELLAGRAIEVPSPKVVEGPRFDNIVTPTAPSQPSPAAANLPYIALDEPPAAEEPAPSVASPAFTPPDGSSPPSSPPPVSAAHLGAAYEAAAPEAPLYEPPVQQAPAYEPPAYEPPTSQRPAYESPSTYAAPTHTDSTYGTPAHETPSYAAPSYAAPSYATPSYATPSYDAPTEVAPAPLAPPQFGAAPALDLPKISYPEFTPTEEPVAERVSTTRGRRPLRLVGAIVVLVAGAYAARAAYSPTADTPMPTVADRPALPPAEPRGATRAVAQPAPARSAPAGLHSEGAQPKTITPRPAIAAPASSGFAAALQSRAIVSGPAPAPAASAPAASDSVTPIAPQPIELDVSVPSLASSESLVPAPRQRGDSAMKRILKAVGGGKEPSPKP